MQSLILTLHIIVCVLLVILILLQAGKEGMGVIFGGGNSSVFGSTGAGGILVKLTTMMALIFVVTSLSYTYVTSSHPEKESTILDVQIEGKALDELAPVPAQDPAKKDEGAVKEGAEKEGKADSAATQEAPKQSPSVSSEKKEPAQATQDAGKNTSAQNEGGQSAQDAKTTEPKAPAVPEKK